MAYRLTTKDTFEWTSIAKLINNVKYAVLLLNHSMDHVLDGKSDMFDRIWRKAERRVAVDGGVRYLRADHQLPDIVSGDFDSAPADRLDHFRRLGVKVMETPDQNYTDFQKAVRIVLHANKRTLYENNNSSIGQPLSDITGNSDDTKTHRSALPCDAIIAIWSSMGRIDHVLSNINTLYVNEKDNGVQTSGTDDGRHYVPIILVQVNNSVTWLLHKGTHVIESWPAAKWCSLVPLGGPCIVTTTGFRWNLTHQTLEFGSLISTSNEFDSTSRTVRVDTDRPLLYSYDISPTDPLV